MILHQNDRTRHIQYKNALAAYRAQYQEEEERKRRGFVAGIPLFIALAPELVFLFVLMANG